MRKKVTVFSGKKKYKSACQEEEATGHWYFGSIAQVTVAAGVITRFDIKPLAFVNLTTIVAVCFRYASLCISRPGVAVFF